jgi:integrase/recombinase XerD
MNLAEGIQLYADAKRSAGALYPDGIRPLASLSRYAGDVPLNAITTRQVGLFLEGPRTSEVTWHQKYNALKNFFLFWRARNEILALPLPPRRPNAVSTFVPYIYSRAEIRQLLSSIRFCQKRNSCKIDVRTFRVLLLFLYGTGALVSEALRLQRDEVDFKKRVITLRSNRFNRRRVIPICPDLLRVLWGYHLRNHWKEEMKAPQFFLNKKGEVITEQIVEKTFQRLRAVAGIVRDDGACCQPRLHDLRHSFAVHRVTAWIKHGADLNRMLPALSAYIGQVGLHSTSRYLTLTPERFRAQLDKLSPRRGKKKRWRDDPGLMKFLAEV